MCVGAWVCPKCVYLSEKSGPCIVHMESVMNFTARKTPEGRVVSCKGKKREKYISSKKVLPPPLRVSE